MKASEVMSQISSMASYQAGARANTANNTNFQDVMDSNLQSKQEKGSNAVEKKPTASSNSNDLKDNNASKKVASNAKKSDSTKATNNASNSKNVIADKVEQLNTEIKNTVKDSLGITEEQLEDIMSTLGLNYLQLLEPSNLAQVFMEANGLTDATEMLTNELLSNQFSQLVEQVGQIDLDDLGLTAEDIAAYLENLNVKSAEHVQTKEVVATVEDTEDEGINTQTNVGDTSNVENQSIKVEVQNYKSGSDASEDRSKDEDASVEQANLNTILNNVTKVTTVESFGDELVQVQQMRDVVNQVVEQIKVVIKPEQTSMEMNLNPESLGKVNLLVAQKDGMITAQFRVQNEVAKEALESQMQTLKDNFESQGVKVEAVEVTVSNLPFSQENMPESGKEQKQSTSKKRNINLADLDLTEDDLTEEEAMKINIMNQNGNSVDYSA